MTPEIEAIRDDFRVFMKLILEDFTHQLEDFYRRGYRDGVEADTEARFRKVRGIVEDAYSQGLQDGQAKASTRATRTILLRPLKVRTVESER